MFSFFLFTTEEGLYPICLVLYFSRHLKFISKQFYLFKYYLHFTYFKHPMYLTHTMYLYALNANHQFNLMHVMCFGFTYRMSNCCLSFHSIEIDKLISKRLTVENKAKLYQLEIVNKQYWRGGVLSSSWESFALFFPDNCFKINISI